MVLCQEGEKKKRQIGWFLFQEMKKDWGGFSSVPASSRSRTNSLTMINEQLRCLITPKAIVT